MKRCIILFAVILLCQPGFTQGWQWLNPLPQGNDLQNLEYIGDNQLLGVSYEGTAIRSADGGATWSICNTGEELFPLEMDFVNASVGCGFISIYSWAADSLENTIVRTTDGGQSWQPVYHNPHATLYDITFPTETSGWAIGKLDTSYNLLLVHTTDGGLTWNEQYGDSLYHPRHAFFLNEQEGWISASHLILHTTDGGQNWQRYESDYFMYFDLCFLDSQNGWGTSFDEIYRTSDGGQTWTPLSVPSIPTEMLKATAVLDENTIWTVSSTDGVHDISDHIIYTMDGGQSWMRYDYGSTSRLEDIVFADPQRGWICGDNGLVLQTEDGGATWTRRCGNTETEGTYFSNIDFVDTHNGWMVTNGGSLADQIMHTTDGGITWETQYSDPSFAFYDVAALSLTNIWVAGNSVLHSTNGGADWSTVDVSTTAMMYYDIVCPNEQVIWLYSEGQGGHHVHRSIDGGATWDTHEAPFVWKYNGMAAGDANNVWVTEWADRLDEGHVYHSADGGVTWETQADDLGFLDGIYFVDAMNGWAGSWPGLVHTTDGGAHWTTVDVDFHFQTELIKFIDPLNGWVISPYNAFRTQDGGETWQAFNHFAGPRIIDIDFVDADHVWICGWYGTLLYFDGTTIDTPEPTVEPAPSSYLLRQNFPNPFNPTTTISFTLPQTGLTSLVIYDLLGRTVQTLIDRPLAAGSYYIPWNAETLPSGVYFYRLTSGNFSAVKKTILLK